MRILGVWSIVGGEAGSSAGGIVGSWTGVGRGETGTRVLGTCSAT